MGDGKPSLSGHMAQCLHRAIRSAEKMNALGEAIMNPVIIGEYVMSKNPQLKRRVRPSFFMFPIVED